ncbi:MAG TPA: DUF4394 domain-containing protein [Rubrivivax sp.]
MNRFLRDAAAAALCCAAATVAMADDGTSPGCASGAAANASKLDDYSLKTPLAVVGLTAGGQLVCFGDRKPEKTWVIGTVGGFTGSDARLIGIDFRPQDGALYGVGNAGGLYRVDTAGAMLTPIGQLTTVPDPAATAFGVDFNPAANALRIVSNTGQNLRQSFANLGTVNPLAATAVDGTLGYTANATPGATASGVLGAAYTNNDLAAATATSLLVLDASLAQVALQSPANAGFLVATGKLGVAPTAGGFDIYSVLRGGVTVAQRALASIVVGGVAGLYDIDLLTGLAASRGSFGAMVVDIAVPLNQF